MKIDFVSRGVIRRLIDVGKVDPEKHVVISINDTLHEYKEMFELLTSVYDSDNNPEGWQNYTCLMFNDDERDFSDTQARVIKTFVDNHGTKKDYIIHCFAGVSRSGAIAKWINEYLQGNNWYLEDYAGHNSHVYDMLHCTSGTSINAYYRELEKQERKGV